ncbi:MAG: hypothetical protein P4L71_21850 [Acetobacteraceae bacterium]|nr:hypothetical protein [Acetobacteraceae bacterium]
MHKPAPTAEEGTYRGLMAAWVRFQDPAGRMKFLAGVAGNRLADLEFVSEAPGVLQAVVADTHDRPVGAQRCDVRVLVGGLPVISDTFPIWVDQAVTRS